MSEINTPEAPESEDSTSPFETIQLPPAAIGVESFAAFQADVITPRGAEYAPLATETAPLESETAATDLMLVASTPKRHANADQQRPADSFSNLGLPTALLETVENSGYQKPTEIQARIIPHMLDGRDVLAQSQTGTGKTAAFALPILARTNLAERAPQVLVLAPTRELAIQVAKSFRTYGDSLNGLFVATLYGGQDYSTQFRMLNRGVQIVVGTPGRVIDHIKRGTLELGGIKTLVLDEADEMLNMGFLEDVQLVLSHTPADRQIALFSATLPAPIRKIADEYLDNPAKITIKAKTMTAESIRQRALFLHHRDKFDALTRLLEVEDTDGVIVFANTKNGTMELAEQLQHQGFSAVALNGDMPQNVRERTVDQLKSGRLDIVVATDVAARGLDVSRVSHVFNFDMPFDSESYVHRIGRTGRAGRTGEAIIFLTNSQRGRLRMIERTTKQVIQVVEPPTADEVNAARVQAFVSRIATTAESQDLGPFAELLKNYGEESETPMLVIASALAQMTQGERPFFVQDRPQRPQRDRDRVKERQRNDARRLSDTPEEGMKRYRIEVGWQDGAKPGQIVGAVANEGGINGKQIGAIRIQDSHSTIDLPSDMPAHVLQTLWKTRVAGKPLHLSLATDEDSQLSRQRKRPFKGKRQHSKKRFNGQKRGRKTRSK